MQVSDKKDLGNGHFIEIGDATWNPNATSVRNRYPTATGGFSPRSSSEIPLGDLEPIISMVADHDLLPPDAAAKIIESLAASIRRLSKNPRHTP